MNNDRFDEILGQMRNDSVDDAQVQAATERVWAKLAKPEGARSPDGQLRNCGDFQALLGDFRTGRLTESRRLLVEDHLRGCVACRHANEEARSGKVVRMSERTAVRKPVSYLPWAIAATLVAGVAIGSLSLMPSTGQRAEVLTIDGGLFRVGNGAVPVTRGIRLNENEAVRTAKASYAVLRLNDGSTVELNERSGVSVSQGWMGTTIRLESGNIIVKAAKQKHGRLYVTSGDATVSVKGTIFAVSRGMKGTRVSVVEGEVKVDQTSASKLLHRGEQTTTDPSLAATSVAADVAWSKNAAEYLAVLGEFQQLSKQIAAIPGPGLRYQSKLAGYLPANAIVYAALPNLGSTLAQANQLFQTRLQQSPVLQQWWNEQGSHGAQLEDLITRLKAFSATLGDEIVVTTAGVKNTPAVMALVTQPDNLKTLIAIANTQAGTQAIQVVETPAALTAAKTGAVLYLRNGVMALSSDLSTLQAIAPLLEKPASTVFPQAPLFQQVGSSYKAGAGWLIAADMEQIMASAVPSKGQPGKGQPAIQNMQFLVAERKQMGTKTENRATLTFGQQRSGIAAWLGAPGAMGSLDFVSADAGLAASFVVKDPKSLVQEMIDMSSKNNPNFSAALAEFESKTGVNLVNDLAAPLGGEFSFAIDGPGLPTDSWKFSIEVYNPDRLQWAINRLVNGFNQYAPATAGKLHLDSTQVSGRTYYTLRSDKPASPQIHYAYVDNYLVAGASDASVTRSVQTRQTGYTLSRSSNFRSQLPTDGYTNFSALLYTNLGPAMKPFADMIASSATAAQWQSIQALVQSSEPSLIYAYGQPDSITVASTGGFLGFGLDAVMALSHLGHSGMPGAAAKTAKMGMARASHIERTTP